MTPILKSRRRLSNGKLSCATCVLIGSRFNPITPDWTSGARRHALESEGPRSSWRPNKQTIRLIDLVVMTEPSRALADESKFQLLTEQIH